MSKKVLFMEGDGIGPSVIKSAERVLSAATDEVEIVHGEIGRSASDATGQYLPHETMDLLDECKIIMTGPIFLPETGDDPINTLTIQLDLFARVKHFKTLAPDLGAEGRNIALWGSNNNIDAEISEIADLDGVTLSKYVKSAAYDRMMRLARENNDKYGVKKVSCLIKDDFFPLSSGMFKERFEAHFPSDQFDTTIMNVVDWATRSIKYPPEEQCILCVDLYSQIVAGVLGGVTGYDYLAPTCFVGDEYRMYKPCKKPDYDDIMEVGFINPTAAISSISSILSHLGLEDEAHAVMDSLTDAYLNNRRTPDVGGSLTTEQFTDVIIENIKSRLA
jgi:isocitrate/isopropylmalate dehydrogenase